jgi:pyruvate dehydrogenase E2 component (dihydrolipoamide acetyltransferase)
MAIECKIPELGENIKSGTVAAVLVSVGDHVAKDQSLVELETEKAVLEVPTEHAGVVKEILIKAGQSVEVGQAIILLQEETAAASAPQKSKAEPPSSVAPEPAEEKKTTPAPIPQPVVATPKIDAAKIPAAAAPSVRRFAREIGVVIDEIKGSGPFGRISIEDVKAHSKRLLSERVTGTVAAVALPELLPDFSRWGEIVREPMSAVREKTALHLSNAWRQIPHVTQFDKADITELEKLRKQYGAQVEQAGGKLTMTAILLKAVAAALKIFPQFNASVNMANKEVIYKKYYNIGVAVDTSRGLLVPVIRNADRKNLTELAVELAEISQKARDRKLTLDDMSGGNFTISNLGGIGGTFFSPIINAPEAAILGVSRAATEPVYQQEKWVPRLMLPLSLSYDHRIIDGADGARFIRWIVEALEQPFAMILEG